VKLGSSCLKLTTTHNSSKISLQLQPTFQHATMSNMHVEELSRLPNEMRIFSIVTASTRSGPRLGVLSLPGRQAIQTPNYVGNTSRGAVPHFTPDMQHKHSKIKALYMGLEDCKYPCLSDESAVLTAADGDCKS